MSSETCLKDSSVFCICKQCWDERNRKARENHNAAIREQERRVKDYWHSFTVYEQFQARRRFCFEQWMEEPLP